MVSKKNEQTFNFYHNGKKPLTNTESKIILITGGAGFIGSNFIRFIHNKYPEYKIINFDKLTYAGNLNNLSSLEKNPNYIFVKGDIVNKEEIKNVFEDFNPDFVVHFAAESHVDRSINNPDIFIKTNIMGTQNILCIARENNVKKFVFISTDEVYGSVNYGRTCTEESSISPGNFYALSKASADLLVQISYQTYGQRTNIIRSCNNYGAYQFPEKLIPLMILKIMKNEKLPIYGSGRNIRDWIYVDDNCRAIDLVLHNGRPGEIYNVSSNNEKENIDVIELIIEKMGSSKDLISFVLDRPDHDYRYSSDASKIKRDLGWKPLVSFEEGLNRTIQWYQTHSEWIEKINSSEYIKYYEQVHKN